MSSPRHFNFLIFMNDPKFTEKLKKWFDCEHTDANIREGALLLLQMNNNRHLYSSSTLTLRANSSCLNMSCRSISTIASKA